MGRSPVTDGGAPKQAPLPGGGRAGTALVPPHEADVVDFSRNASMRPLLLVVVDTEEEFDWSRPLSRDNTAVTSIAGQWRAQEIFARHAVVPTYVIDYPVAVDDRAAGILREFAEGGRCRVGAHLHPWVNPPFREDVTPGNSFPGNLPAALEREKLRRLTETIVRRLGRPPIAYKAGRYGVGPNTAAVLEELGYRIDLSVVPYTSFAAEGGPDFSQFGFSPFWFGSRRTLLEVPLSCGFWGAMRGLGQTLYPRLASPLGMRLRAPGLFARSGLLERIRLTPEGVDHAAQRRLTESLLAQGCRVFSLTYHSPSLVPGHTPYVRDDRDLAIFLEALDRYLAYFFGDVGGRPVTPEEVYELAFGAAG